MPHYIFDLTGSPAVFMGKLGANNHGTGCFWIFCGGRPVLMSTILQTCGFYVRGDNSSIKAFWNGNEGRVDRVTDHEEDPDLFVLWCGEAQLEVERKVRARTYAESDSDTIVLAK